MCKYVYGHHIPKENIEEHEKECYEEHFCNGNKTPFNDKTFIIPNPLRNHSSGSVSSSDPEWEEEVQINHQTEPEDQDGELRVLKNAGETNRLRGATKADGHNVYECDLCMVD